MNNNEKLAASKTGEEVPQGKNRRIKCSKRLDSEDGFNTFLSPAITLNTLASDSLKANLCKEKGNEVGTRSRNDYFNFTLLPKVNSCALALNSENRKLLRKSSPNRDLVLQDRGERAKAKQNLPVKQKSSRIVKEKEVPLRSPKLPKFPELPRMGRKMSYSTEFRTPNPKKRKLIFQPSSSEVAKRGTPIPFSKIFQRKISSGPRFAKEFKDLPADLFTEIEINLPLRKRTMSECTIRSWCPPPLNLSSKDIVQAHMKEGIKKPGECDEMDSIEENSEGSSHPSESLASMVGLVPDDLF
ncbi:unnamed protein product [Moneuplotes crassus]|uniref:Uncharacterized protein n=1 Tax=Euplotes crassus TaxID=5936 RepID=A0AAD1UMB4_EUPCR|nr:unnamed protein product [Moneuplotes crassus]